MELRFIISGTPKGECQWAPKEEYSYIGTLYTKSDVSHRFDIRLRNNGNGNYAFYHYLIYNTISDNGGRPGGYLGLTLRLDSFCPDYKSIYSVLDMVYRKMIIGHIVKGVGDGRMQYVCMHFDEMDNYLRQIEGSIKTMLSPVLSQADITKINTVPHGGIIPKMNMGESGVSDVYNALERYGFCSLSPEYPSRIVEAQLKERYEQGRLSRQNEVNILAQRLQDANNEIKRQEAVIESLEQDKPDATTNDKAITKSTVASRPAKQQQTPTVGKQKKTDRLKILILVFLVIVTLLLLCILFFKA